MHAWEQWWIILFFFSLESSNRYVFLTGTSRYMVCSKTYVGFFYAFSEIKKFALTVNFLQLKIHWMFNLFEDFWYQIKITIVCTNKTIMSSFCFPIKEFWRLNFSHSNFTFLSYNQFPISVLGSITISHLKFVLNL